MALQLTGRFNLLSRIADKACLKNKGVEQGEVTTFGTTLRLYYYTHQLVKVGRKTIVEKKT